MKDFSLKNPRKIGQTPIVGLLGGIAAGKSFVSAELVKLGCSVINADIIGHQVLESPDTQSQLLSLFGASIQDDHGSVDRKRLANLVFGSDVAAQQRRRQLESVVHPAIRREAERQLNTLLKSPEPPRAIIVDAPLLIEAGWVKLCNVVLFVDTPDEIRRQRAAERGWSEQQWRDREAAQVSIEEKRLAACHVVPGNIDLESMRVLLIKFLDEINQ